MTHGGIKTYQLRAQWMQSYKEKYFRRPCVAFIVVVVVVVGKVMRQKTFQETLCWPLLPGEAEEAKESTNSKRKSEAGNLDV